MKWKSDSEHKWLIKLIVLSVCRWRAHGAKANVAVSRTHLHTEMMMNHQSWYCPSHNILWIYGHCRLSCFLIWKIYFSFCLPVFQLALKQANRFPSLSQHKRGFLQCFEQRHTHTRTRTHTLLNSGPILSNLNLINSKARPLQADIPCYRDTKVALLSLFTLYPLNSRCHTEMRERTAQCSLSDPSILCFNWFVSPERKLKSAGSSVWTQQACTDDNRESSVSLRTTGFQKSLAMFPFTYRILVWFLGYHIKKMLDGNARMCMNSKNACNKTFYARFRQIIFHPIKRHAHKLQWKLNKSLDAQQ